MKSSYVEFSRFVREGQAGRFCRTDCPDSLCDDSEHVVESDDVLTRDYEIFAVHINYSPDLGVCFTAIAPIGCPGCKSCPKDAPHALPHPLLKECSQLPLLTHIDNVISKATDRFEYWRIESEYNTRIGFESFSLGSRRIRYLRCSPGEGYRIYCSVPDLFMRRPAYFLNYYNVLINVALIIHSWPDDQREDFTVTPFLTDDVEKIMSCHRRVGFKVYLTDDARPNYGHSTYTVRIRLGVEKDGKRVNTFRTKLIHDTPTLNYRSSAVTAL